MENPTEKIMRLLERTGWTDDDKKWMLEYLENHGDDELKALMQTRFYEHNLHHEALDPVAAEKLLDRIHTKIGVGKTSKNNFRFNRWVIRLAAACIIGCLISGYYWLAASNPHQITINRQLHHVGPTKFPDVTPGTNKAVLTLADGSTLLLDDAQNGALTKQGNTTVLKLDGKIAYQAARSASKEVVYNKITTPRGGQYQIVLPDGSKVWLNAASSLRFPTAFTGKERRVEITGEAYFEIVHDETAPFIVAVQQATVQVLGTHFNVMAYDEEEVIQTTLLEGSVTFSSGNHSGTLKPGQQSKFSKSGNLKIEHVENVQDAVAWKNGYFHFENADIETVMRQLSRWYNVAVVYPDKATGERFFADIPRDIKLSDALKAIALTGKIDFEIQDSRIIIGYR